MQEQVRTFSTNLAQSVLGLFRRKKTETSDREEITPDYIERLIEETGSKRVFAKARELGWKDGGAPLWVWNQICAEIQREDTLTKGLQG